jgi:hypothetical protein
MEIMVLKLYEKKIACARSSYIMWVSSMEFYFHGKQAKIRIVEPQSDYSHHPPLNPVVGVDCNHPFGENQVMMEELTLDMIYLNPAVRQDTSKDVFEQFADYTTRFEVRSFDGNLNNTYNVRKCGERRNER